MQTAINILNLIEQYQAHYLPDCINHKLYYRYRDMTELFEAIKRECEADFPPDPEEMKNIPPASIMEADCYNETFIIQQHPEEFMEE